MATYKSDAQRLNAVRVRDQSADEHFVYGVITTGVVCYPSCASRAAQAAHMQFYSSVAQALNAGFRHCKRCRTDLPPLSQRHLELVVRACRLIAADEGTMRVDALAKRLQISRYYLQKLFKQFTGVSPKVYMQAIRAARFDTELNAQTSITEAIVDAGYDSVSGFYDQVHARLGMTASAKRKGGKGEQLLYGFAQSRYGLLLVATTSKGVCAVLFGETKDELVEQLSLRFHQAQLTFDEQGLHTYIQAVIKQIDEPAWCVDIPLDIRGTLFQEKVWRALRQIPVGQTASYAQLAKNINQPKAMRAVAKACSANPLAVLVPCHRVIKANGELSGYRWGVERKRALLDDEKNTQE